MFGLFPAEMAFDPYRFNYNPHEPKACICQFGISTESTT